MEPLMPSEVARLVYGYLKKEKNEDAAVCFLKTSPHLTECYQMFKANRKFNIKVNGFNLHDIFDNFGTMCTMIEKRIPETCESKTLIEKLQYVLDTNHIPTKKDKLVEKKLNMVDKCVGNTVNTKDQSTHTTINIEANKSISEELLEVPSFTDIISNNISKTKEPDTFNDETTITDEKNSFTFSSPCLSTMTQLENNTGTMTISKFDEKESKIFQVNKQICSTPAKKNEQTKINIELIPQFSPKNSHNQYSGDQAENQQIPEATSLDSMPGFSKEDRIKDGSIAIDTGELVDTFLNDQSLLEKIADTINKSFDAQNETNNILESKVLDPPTLEKALDSTQSDPQIKNILDEFLVFNVDNADIGKETCTNDELDNSIKSRLRSARKKDDVPSKSKKNNLNIPKHIVYGNEECLKVDNNILLIHEVEDYYAKSDYVKIAPKITPMLKTHQASEKLIFPKRRRQLLEVPGIRSKFRRTNITRQPLGQTPKSIVIEVPNQNSFEIQEKNHIEINDVIKLPEVSSKVNNVMVHDTPDDRLKPPKSKSMSTPRRRSTHIRCLDFSTPQPKNMNRNQARSKLFCDSPKRLEKCLEEPSSSPLPKLQADWGSVNGFESMIKKEVIKHWDTDIREMVGAGILTSDADGRKTRKKKTPRKKIKSVNVQNDSVLLKDQKKSSNISIATNELQTDVSNISEITYDGLNEQDSTPLLDIQKPLLEKNTKCPPSLETLNNVTELYNKQPLIKSNSLNTLNNLKSLKRESEFSISLETPDKITELYNEEPPTISDSLKNINDKESLIKQSEFLISLETPDKTAELYTKQPSVKSVSSNDNNEKSFDKQSESTIPLETPDKITELNNKQLSIKSDSSKSECATQIKLEQSRVNELKNNQNQLINSSILNTMPEITNQEKDSNFLKKFHNHNYSSIENKSNEPTKPLKDQGFFVQIDTNSSSELNSPLKCISIESVKPNLVETPYKCDDAAVDVPETPISKIIREYDPSKMVTPLPCTPEHDESLTETPLTKVFRETSYLNRAPISPFPPTPGNSMSVDTLIIPPEQDHFKTSNNINCKINSLEGFLTQPIETTTTKSELSTKSKKVKVKCTPLKPKLKMSTKSKVKNGLKINNIEEKKKQVYESVKVELFGSDISVSPYKPELLKTNEQNKSIVINKKPKEEEKKSGFKPIPKRKSIESTSVVNVNGIEDHFSDELNMQPTNTPFIKPIIVQCENNTSGKVKKTISKKINKSMVHFDDPVEKFFRLSKSPTLDESNNKKIGKIQNNTTVNENDNSEKLIGLSRYLNKTSSTVYDCSPKEKKIKTIEPTVNISKLNNSDSNINYSEMYNVGKSSKNISKSDISKETKTNEMNNIKIESENCVIDVNKVCNEKENVKQIMSLDDTPNCTSENKMNTSLDRSESPIVVKSVVNNTSCITITHDDNLDVQINKVCDSLSNMKYLKKQKVYEVFTDDGEHAMVKLNVSEIFTLLDIASELDLIASPSITTNKILDVTPKIESGELENDKKILMPVTSTPKDNVDIKIEKDDRSRRSPSFWDDSVHNYPIKHRDDRYREKNRRQNKIHNKYDYKHRSSKLRCHDERFDSPIHHSQRSHHQNVKREFTEDSVKDIHRYKYKNEHRRSYHDYYSKGRKWQEENERFSIPQRMSQNELPKSNRSEDIVKKATKRPADRTVYNKTPSKVSKVEHQRLLKNVDVDDFLSVVHGRK
ncbi:unnamed protein product [Macrosiphum euphorbiae]|uniref:LisH domain-containing protein n=1 Tax=Macrosiphum euphorbiae TaxID=13131 RepID=A0AAV0X4W6_9HEMI|nr:unnamed protein product [Macrosiphum euphorbiae]